MTLQNRKLPEENAPDNESGPLVRMTMDFLLRMGCSREAAAICVRALSARETGSVCLEITGEPERRVLRESPAVSTVPDLSKPLILNEDGTLLYTRRNFCWEQAPAPSPASATVCARAPKGARAAAIASEQ